MRLPKHQAPAKNKTEVEKKNPSEAESEMNEWKNDKEAVTTWARMLHETYT